jgi:hypothetical protein
MLEATRTRGSLLRRGVAGESAKKTNVVLVCVRQAGGGSVRGAGVEMDVGVADGKRQAWP